ncbi:MAG TPA: hypothetical protein VF069_18610 [Streptosporangiaceae bacterium]
MRPSTSVAFALSLAVALAGTLCGCADPAAGPAAGGASEGTAGAAGDGSAGVRGTTTVDSGSPIVYSTPRPRRPLRARLDVVGPAGTTAVAATAESDEQGRFEIPLRPGTYTIRPRNLTGAPVPTARPVTVTVRPGTWTTITIPFDSGIR